MPSAIIAQVALDFDSRRHRRATSIIRTAILFQATLSFRPVVRVTVGFLFSHKAAGSRRGFIGLGTRTFFSVWPRTLV